MFQLFLTNIKMCFVSLDCCNASAVVADFSKISCIRFLWIQKSVTENITDATNCHMWPIADCHLCLVCFFQAESLSIQNQYITVRAMCTPSAYGFCSVRDMDPESRSLLQASKAWGSRILTLNKSTLSLHSPGVQSRRTNWANGSGRQWTRERWLGVIAAPVPTQCGTH